ncbi:MAG: NADPH-dependent FMN reductase [Bryobacteraceae bacterium]
MRFLTVSGSLRASSSNTALLEAAGAVVPAGIALERYTGLGDLPHFNPDIDDEGVSEHVREWRRRLTAADAVIFSTPEYAHGVPGVLKNALDWVVGSGELVGKPVALFHASSRGVFAQASLKETLTVMSANVVAEVTVDLWGTKLGAGEIAGEVAMAGVLRAGLEALAGAVA